MRNRKNVSVLAFAILVVLIITYTLSVVLRPSLPREVIDEDKPIVSSIMSHTGRERVFIADLYKRVDTETKRSIERTLYDSLNKDQPDLYTGTIREKSFTEKTLPSTQTISTFLVDTAPLQTTYKITLFSSPSGRPSINVECAPPEQQLISSKICKDMHHHE